MFGMKLSPIIQCNAPAFKSSRSPQFTCKNTSQSTQDQKYQKQSNILYQRLRSLIIKPVIETQWELWERNILLHNQIKREITTDMT